MIFLIRSFLLSFVIAMLSGCASNPKALKTAKENFPITHVYFADILATKCYVYKVVDIERVRLKEVGTIPLNSCSMFPAIHPSQYKKIPSYIELLKGLNW